MNDSIILICSNEAEGSTDFVCEWLNYLNKPFLRFCHKDKIEILQVLIFNNEIDIKFTLKGKTLFLSEVKSYWYRRSSLKFSDFDKIEINSRFDYAINDYLLPTENDQIIKYFKNRLNEKAILNKEEDNQLLKLDALYWAKKYELTIPDTQVTRTKEDLNFFKNNDLITKAIGDIIFEVEGTSYSMMTNKIEINEIQNEYFFPTLFQNLVDKKFELRVFFFNEKFYSTAIFSQNNEKTKVDFRNYDRDFPNRVVPYRLPIEIEQKLSKLMAKLDLKSGSIDLAYTKDGDYVFFEVNPVGQFEQVSIPCNYEIFKKVAIFL